MVMVMVMVMGRVVDLDGSTTEAIMAERITENKLRKRDENIRILSAIIHGLSHGCLARHSIYISHKILRSLDQYNKLAYSNKVFKSVESLVIGAQQKAHSSA